MCVGIEHDRNLSTLRTGLQFWTGISKRRLQDTGLFYYQDYHSCVLVEYTLTSFHGPKNVE